MFKKDETKYIPKPFPKGIGCQNFPTKAFRPRKFYYSPFKEKKRPPVVKRHIPNRAPKAKPLNQVKCGRGNRKARRRLKKKATEMRIELEIGFRNAMLSD